MERNIALELLRALRKGKGQPITDEALRKLINLSQEEIDIGAAELEAEGMVEISRTYTLIEE